LAEQIATTQVSDEDAFPDEDLNKSATRGDILLLAQYMQTILARIKDVESKVSPPKPDFDTDWCEIGPQSAIRHNISGTVRDVEGTVKTRGGSYELPYESSEGQVRIRSISDSYITVINTTPRHCQTRIKGYYT
jgi:hypothetical protein